LKALFQPALPLVVAAPYSGVPADITADSLCEKGIAELMASFSTSFDPANTNRSQNIKLAASQLHGRLLAPGEILSVNAVIGDTTPDKGYLEAPVIIGGELRPGFGGGLCQISSTLYNAVLLADLAVVERHNHQLTVSYLPPGRDATIEYGSRDFKLLNNTDHHILIHAVVGADTLTFRLFGQSPHKEVEITVDELAVYPPPTRYIYDPDLAPGEEVIEEGVPSYLVEVWKTVYQNGKELSRQQLSVDWYGPASHGGAVRAAGIINYCKVSFK
jgi:vancomycin resistance protein YoaR